MYNTTYLLSKSLSDNKSRSLTVHFITTLIVRDIPVDSLGELQ